LRSKDEKRRRNDIKNERSNDGIMQRTTPMFTFRDLGLKLQWRRLRKCF